MVFDGVLRVGLGGFALVVLVLVVAVVMAMAATAMRVRAVLKWQEINDDQNSRLGFQPLGQTLDGQRRVFEVVEPKTYRCDVEVIEIWSAELWWYCGA